MSTESVTQKPPFFIVGAHRSGTTMLRLMLNNHPHLAVPYESDFITLFYHKLPEYGDLGRQDNVTKLLHDICANPHVKKGKLIEDPQEILAHPITTYADLVQEIFTTYAQKKGKQRWGDKTPGYVTELDVVWKLFPGCRIVHLVRDGRDVAVSLRGLEWGSSHIPSVAEDWRWKTTLGHKVGAVLGEHYLEVHYEDLVLKTAETLRTICAFLQEPYDEALLAFHERAEGEMPAESIKWHQNSVRPPDPNIVYAWKHKMSIADRIIFEDIAGPTLAMFGYECEHHQNTLASSLKRLYYSTVKRR